MNNLVSEAIEAAIKGNWDKAIKTNKLLLSENPTDVDALNRLAKGYFEIGKASLAKKTYKKVLEFDPNNQIAIKCMAKITDHNTILNSPIDTDTLKYLIEDPSRTSTVTLANLGSYEVISPLHVGEEVLIRFNTHKVSVTNKKGQYLGRIPDLSAVKLRAQYAKAKNYKAIVRSQESGVLKVSIVNIA